MAKTKISSKHKVEKPHNTIFSIISEQPSNESYITGELGSYVGIQKNNSTSVRRTGEKQEISMHQMHLTLNTSAHQETEVDAANDGTDKSENETEFMK